MHMFVCPECHKAHARMRSPGKGSVSTRIRSAAQGPFTAHDMAATIKADVHTVLRTLKRMPDAIRIDAEHKRGKRILWAVQF